MSMPYNRELIPRAKELRKNMTSQENKLWYQFLSGYPVRFQRQKTIGGFIVDFYCAKAVLVVELDGKPHFSEQGLAYDEERTALLMQKNVLVIRFSNSEVENCFGDVCRKIAEIVQSRIKSGNTKV